MAGFYDGPIDGVYGPSTVAAVEALQTEADLPVTGFVDEATAAALSAAVSGVSGTEAEEAVVHAAAVQSALKLAGYWPGAIDGEWTPELTEALKALQADLDVEPTGEVDTATLRAPGVRHRRGGRVGRLDDDDDGGRRHDDDHGGVVVRAVRRHGRSSQDVENPVSVPSQG